MAALATGDLEPTTIQHLEEPEVQAHELGSTALLDIIRACLHANSAEWIFLRELRVGTGSPQRRCPTAGCVRAELLCPHFDEARVV